MLSASKQLWIAARLFVGSSVAIVIGLIMCVWQDTPQLGFKVSLTAFMVFLMSFVWGYLIIDRAEADAARKRNGRL